jgi:protein phosphatase
MSHVDADATEDYIPKEVLATSYFPPSPAPVRVAFGAASHRGKVRPINEDHYVVLHRHGSLGVLMANLPEEQLPPPDDRDAYVMAVADGMGGAASGERASMLVLRTAIDLVFRQTKWTMEINESEFQEAVESLMASVRLIDRTLIEHARSEPRLSGMGTTLTAAYTVGLEAFIIHVGDSRAYLFRAGTLQRLTRDHTVAQELIDSGQVAPDSDKARRLGHVLTNYLGGPGGGGAADVHPIRLADGDRLLLCTDGLTGLVDEVEVARTLGLHAEPGDACRALVDLALERGGHDNVTVVLGSYTISPKVEDASSQEVPLGVQS